MAGEGEESKAPGGEPGSKRGWASWGIEGKYLGEKGILGARKREVVYIGKGGIWQGGTEMKFVKKFQ